MYHKVLVIGGSRNIGYLSAVRLLDSGATVTFLLRKVQVFDGNETIQKYVEQGKARLVQGDALIKDDVQRAWDEAAKGDDKLVDLLLFTVGSPTATFDLRKGMLISPPNLVTQALLNVFETTPPSDPKFIAISSTGVTEESHKALPLVVRIVYGYLIPQPHRDKRGAEQVFAHLADWPWDKKDDVGADILGEDWSHRVRPRGQYKNVLVIRPAWLTDGASLADKTPGKQPYRVKDWDMKGAYKISRNDVSHFIVETAVKHWDEWKGRCVSIAY
ncbi:hypothetical protein PAXRUDRAFT_15452 [Paxillus rubicundulus Ve08.2h10]|uniref:NAD(P)-binding domain-containing protein n=1 Tax=Paxillus rubicundulus Ve08.2h10 TaxID=930991 RepID=A0A0D0DHT3_9AGAM|nr:hypothetical protein PAXRUDRAFT_15452 [Paxillus rubicundulus Ve08.2h10]